MCFFPKSQRNFSFDNIILRPFITLKRRYPLWTRYFPSDTLTRETNKFSFVLDSYAKVKKDLEPSFVLLWSVAPLYLTYPLLREGVGDNGTLYTPGIFIDKKYNQLILIILDNARTAVLLRECFHMHCVCLPTTGTQEC